jgi:ribosomal protein S18 acetylase RimI-like enzyme
MIRPAVSGDAPALAKLKLTAFRQAFLEDFAIAYPTADLARFEAESYGLAKIETELADPAHQTWVVEDEAGALVAYSHCGPCKLPHPEVQPGDPELYQLYMLRAVQGRGLGRQLLELALDRFGTARPVWLGVWSGNDRAQAVYRKHGFRAVGTYQFPVGDWLDDEIIMRRG